MTLREYLLSTALLVETPYQQRGVRTLEKIGVEEKSPKLINGYRVKGDRIFCHICGSHRHLHGLTGQLADGSLILFGRDCAEKFFGPKIWEKCWAEFKRKQDIAFARYRVLNLGKTCEPMKNWLASNRQRILKAKEAWDQIVAIHPKFAAEIETALKQNNNRIVDREDVAVSREEMALGHRQAYFTTTIVATLRGAEAIRYMPGLDKELIIVESFLSALADMPETISDHIILEYSKRLEQNVRTSAKRIDLCLEFITDLLNEDKLRAVGQWSDRNRIRSLRHVENVTPRNIAESIRRLCGTGYEVPRVGLAETIPNLRKTAEELTREGVEQLRS